jgi:hypothetical protein
MTTQKFDSRWSFFARMLPVAFIIILLVSSCSKTDEVSSKRKPSSYSSDVIQKWMTIQMRLMRNATGIPNHGLARHFAYTGVAAMESLEPALHGKQSWTNKWNGLTGLPASSHSKDYYYPANVNAALASMNRLMFPGASVADKAAIDSLENALTQEFLVQQPVALITASAEFGNKVAIAVYNWSETDGYKNANNPYTVPVGPGLWKPTPPALSAPATPYWGNNRTIMTGSIANTQPAPPTVYSADPHSGFYGMVKEVYDVSQNLTDDQKAMVTFWKDVPGATTPGHWLSILRQVIYHEESSLDDAALAYALTGTAINDASITCFKWKYYYNLVRPVTYIREVLGHTTWSSYIGTPAHPEYVSAHSSLSMAAARIIENLFVLHGSFTDHTYDYLGYTARTYPNIVALAMEAGESRLFAGIHYRPSINAGIVQGHRVAMNMLDK